jgi:Gpi18-like mannosyltransferase
MKSTSQSHWIWVATLILVALVVRLAMFDFITDDIILWVIPWYDYLVEKGYKAFAYNFPNANHDIGGNYTPPYYYFLFATTLFNGIFRKLYLIKSISVLFDFVAAIFMYKLARQCSSSPKIAWAGFFSVLFAPTVLANGALWGQCDVIPASLLLASVYFSIVRKPFWVVAFFGAALSFKATGVFLAPYLLMLVLSSQLYWGYLLYVPIVYALMMAPAAIMGRPIMELLATYQNQSALYHSLSMDAPNLYYFVSDKYYVQGVFLGMTATVIISLIFAVLPRRKKVALTRQFLLLSATLSVAMAPFFLPKMHDRYFFAADLLSIALAIENRRLWFVPVLFQCSSTLAYVPILSDSVTGSGGFRGLTPVAILINCALVGFLAMTYWRNLRPTANEPESAKAVKPGLVDPERI